MDQELNDLPQAEVGLLERAMRRDHQVDLEEMGEKVGQLEGGEVGVPTLVQVACSL